LNPDPEGGVAMRGNTRKYVLDAAASSIQQMKAAKIRQSYQSYWEKGLGVSHDDSKIPEWFKQRELRR
jgi:hypothetical protein